MLIDRAAQIHRVLLYSRKTRSDEERARYMPDHDILAHHELQLVGSFNLYRQRYPQWMLYPCPQPDGAPAPLWAEIGSGESIKGRPVFRSVLNLLERGEFGGPGDAISVLDWERVSRADYEEQGRLLNFLRRHLRWLIIDGEILDLTDDRDVEQIEDLIAESRRDTRKIKARLRRGRRAKWRDGGFGGGPRPYGFEIMNRELAPNDAELRYMEQAFEMIDALLDQGRTVLWEEVARRMNGAGARTTRGCLWEGASIRRQVYNPLYRGDIRGYGEVHPGRHRRWLEEKYPRLMSLAARVQDKLRPMRPGAKDKSSFWVPAYCKSCEHRMYADPQQGGAYRYYRCSNPDCTERASVRAGALEEFVFDFLKRLAHDEQLLAEIAAQQNDVTAIRRSKAEARLAEIEREIRQAERIIQRYMQAFEVATTDETAEQLAGRIDEINKRIRALKKESLDCKAAVQAAEMTLQDLHRAREEMAQFDALWEAADWGERRFLVSRWIRRVLISPDGDVTIEGMIELRDIQDHVTSITVTRQTSA